MANFRVDNYIEQPDGSVDLSLSVRSDSGFQGKAQTTVSSGDASGETPERIAVIGFEQIKADLIAQNNYNNTLSIVGTGINPNDPAYSDIVTPGHGEPAPTAPTITLVEDSGTVTVTVTTAGETAYTRAFGLHRRATGGGAFTLVGSWLDWPPGSVQLPVPFEFTDTPGTGDWEYAVRHVDWFDQATNSNVESVTVA